MTFTRLMLLPLLLALLLPSVYAEEPEQKVSDPRTEALQREFEAASQLMKQAQQKGPVDIPLLDQAVLHLPKGYTFVPKAAAAQFMATMGNQVDDNFLGLILPEAEEADWGAVLNYEKSGYIRDDDAKSWNVEDMLKSIRESTEESNQTRTSRGLPGLDVVGWAEAPNYDDLNHRLVWALTVSNQGAPVDEPKSVNYNTYALGRDGIFSLKLVTASNELNQRKPDAEQLLAALEFNSGKRYQDFNADTDPTAGFGLAALVGGAFLAKKFGLFAIASLFIAKFGKFILIAAAALFGIFGKRFGAKKGGGMDA